MQEDRDDRDAPDVLPDATATGDDAAAELVARRSLSAAATPETVETAQRYARPEADRLSEPMLEEVRRGTTGATEAAFFDLDKTIIARSSTLVMGRTFFRDGLISPSTALKSLYASTVYQLVGADHDKMEQMRHAMLDLAKGWEAERIRRLVRETMEEVIVPLVYQEALDLFIEHREAGRDVWIVSSSGEEIVVPFADHLGVADVIATRSGLDDHGRYDGTLEFYAYAKAKATAIRQVAEVRGYDLSRCFAYSDSITDLPMLSAVGNPTAVNPDRELRAAAQAMGWSHHDFVAPVSLRRRLPDIERPSTGVLATSVALLAAGLLVWRVIFRGED